MKSYIERRNIQDKLYCWNQLLLKLIYTCTSLLSILTSTVLLMLIKVGSFSFFKVSKIDPPLPSNSYFTNDVHPSWPIISTWRKQVASFSGNTFIVRILKTTSDELKLMLLVENIDEIFFTLPPICVFLESLSWNWSSVFLIWLSSIPKVSQKSLIMLP